jgi:hypothetical protein
MGNWDTVFHERYPERGATETDIAELIAGLSMEMTSREVAEVVKESPHLSPGTWKLPCRPLPPEYLGLLRWSNGGEFRTGERWFQFFTALDARHCVRATLLAYHLPQYMPGALPFAFNGGGVFYLFDMREPPTQGEYPILCSHACNLGYGPDECVAVAQTFLEACQGRVIVENSWG